MSAHVNVTALVNKATDVMHIDEEGVLNMVLDIESGHYICASLLKEASDKLAVPVGDTKYSAESVYDEGSVLHIPVAPGSVVLTASGVPTVKDRDADGILYFDRVVGSTLAFASDGVTSVPGTRTLTSATTNFITSLVVAGDKVAIGDGEDRGVYTVVTVATNVLTVDSNFPHGSLTLLSFAVYASEIIAGTVNYFTGKVILSYPTSPTVAHPSMVGTVVGTIVPPVVLTHNDTLTITIDSEAPATATFTAVRAQLDGGSGTFAAAAPGDTISIKINNESIAQVLSFGATEDTIQKYIDKFNSQLVGGFCEAGTYALPSMMAFLNEMLTDYNNHMGSTTYHDIADTNTAAGNAIDLASAIILANSLRTNYKAHLIMPSEEEEAVTLLNALVVDYEAHRAKSTASTGHAAADGVNIVNPALVPCTNYATAAALSADLKTKYNAHRSQAGVHSHNDSGNEVTSTTPVTTIAMLKTLVNEIRTDFNAHCIVISQEEECVTLVNELYLDYETHRANADPVTGYHLVADAVNVVNPLLNPATDIASAILLANDIRTCYLAHRSQAGVHQNNDAGNNIASGAAATLADMITLLNQAKVALNGHLLVASNLEEAYVLLNEMKTDYEAHRVATAYHLGADNVNSVSAVPSADTYAKAVTLSAALATAYTAHRSQLGVHVQTDANAIVAVTPPTNMAQLLLLANDLKAKFNLHDADVSLTEEFITLINELRGDYEAHRLVTGGGVHGQGDDVDVINASLPAASDVATAKALCDEIYLRYSAHRQVVGGHTTGAFGGCKFWTHATRAGGAACTFAVRTTGAFGGCRFTALTTGPWGGCGFVFAGGVVTINDASNPFVSTDVGRNIVITGSITGVGQDGTFAITAVAPGGGSCTYNNAAGVTEAFQAATVGTFAVTRTAIIDATAPFTADDVGRTITVTGSTSANNNGTFTIIAVDAGGGSCDYVNAVGVSEIFAGAAVGTLNSVRIADATAPFLASDDGKYIVVARSTTAANDGTYLITTVAGASNWIDVTTATGVTEVFGVNTTVEVIESRATGAFAGCSFTLNGGNVTLADTSNPFLDADVGRSISVRNPTSAGNRGVFIITSVAAGGGAVTYANGAGVTEAFAALTVGLLTSVTIADATNPFVGTDVGKDITVTASTSAGNDGTFLILSRTAGTCDYTNTTGVTEAFAAACVGTIPNVHGVVDPINIVNAALFPCPLTEVGVQLAANELKSKYNDHHTLALGVHGIADPGNTTAAVDVGTSAIHKVDDAANVVTAANVGAAGIHVQDDTGDTVTSPDANATAIHKADDTADVTTEPIIGTAAVHMYDDTADDITAAAAGPGDLSALQTLVADLYVKYPIHIASAVYHKVQDTIDVISTIPSLLHILSDRYGSSSKVEITAGTSGLLTKLGLTTGTATGVTGSNVSNIAAVTAAECKTVVEAALTTAKILVTTQDSKVRMSSATALVDNVSRILVAGTARTKFGFDNITHYGDDNLTVHVSAAYQATTLLSGRTTMTIPNRGELLIRLAAKDTPAPVKVSVIRLT